MSSPAQANSKPVSPAAPLDTLLAAARRRSPADQTRLVMGVADLYSTQRAGTTPQVRLAAVFVELVRNVEAQVRRRLSERLGASDWLPHDLVKMLATDQIEIARPVISASPLLTDSDLLTLLAECSTEHRLQVAMRPGLGEAVSQAILDSDEPLLLTALASNTYANLPPDGMSRLVAAAEQVVSLRQPLVEHPALDETLAEKLFTWVGEALQQTLCERFPEHAERLKYSVSDTVQALNDARLALKLHDAGRLTPASLMRILREGRRGLFLQGLSLLAEIRIDEIDSLLRRPTARQFYLACLAAGIDRAAFPDVLESLRLSGLPVPPALIDTELRLGERDRYQAKLELRALMDSLAASPVFH